MPTEWDELPLSEPSKRALEEAFVFLPLFLNESPLIGDEVFRFTQDGGWQKMNKLLAVFGRCSFGFLGCRLDALREFANKLKVSHFSPFL